jgi:hypothetical protein
MEWVSMDFITDLLLLKWENRVYNLILVMVDIYTKFTVYYPCRKDMTIEDLKLQINIPRNTDDLNLNAVEHVQDL